MIYLVFFQGVVEDPDAIFQEGEVRNLIGVEVEAEPEILVTVELKDHLEEGSWFKKLVADYVLELGQDLEEVVVAHLRVSADVLQTVNHLRLKFDQGFNGYLIDLFESLSI